MSIRPVKYESVATPTMEGAGVKLHRVFGFGDPSLTDPFLMMDDFRNDVPSDYIRGFPGIRIAASRRSPTCWRARWSTVTASEIAATSMPATSSG